MGGGGDVVMKRVSPIIQCSMGQPCSDTGPYQASQYSLVKDAKVVQNLLIL